MGAPIVLMTDFGTQDSYVGVMKGVLSGIAPTTPVIDLTHQIRPQDLAHAAYTLRIALPYFPPETIFCCVVDPGVGSARRAVAVRAGAWWFVLPDNGILTTVLHHWPAQHAVSLTNARYHLPARSATFHGRDIFAPVAAHLATGVPWEQLGERLDVGQLHQLELPGTRREAGRVIGTVMHVDHFGNLVTSLTAEDLGGATGWQIRLSEPELVIPAIARTFADVPLGSPVAYLGSDGFLELAVRHGNAAREWGVALGTEVIAEQTEAATFSSSWIR